MLDDDPLSRFQAGISNYRASRISKLRRGHVKLAYSKLLEWYSMRLGIGLKRRAKLFWGQEMTGVYQESTSLAVSRYGFYEEGLTRMVLEFLKPGMTFVDVGAHAGYFTLLGAWLVGDSGQVHSFEPTPSIFEVLRSNAEPINNVCLNQVAVAAKSGIATLNDYGSAYSAYNSMYVAGNTRVALNRVKSTEFRSPVVSLDEYVAQERVAPNFVKIDAEGAEYEIFQGMEETLARCRPMIFIEVGSKDIEGVLPSRDVVQYLLDKKYQAYEFKDGGIVRHQPKERYEYENILFLPES